MDRRWPEQGLLLAGWTLANGETYCPACATARGFPDPRGFDPSPPPRGEAPPEADEPEAAPAGIAIAAAGTSEAVRRYFRGALISTFVGLAGLIAVIVVVALQIAHERDLYASGIHTNGVIVALQRCGCGGPATVSYHAGLEALEGHEDLPTVEPGYYLGESIDVSYDPYHPSRLNSPTASLPPAWGRPLSLAGVFGLALLVGGLAGVRRATRWRVLLAGAAWRAYRLTYIRVPRRSPGLLLSAEGEAGTSLNLRLAPVFKWRSTMLKTASGRVVWLAGDPAAPTVLAVHPGLQLFPARPLRSRERGSYQKALARVEAMRSLSPSERRAATAKAYQRSELRVVVGWGCLGLLTISHPSTLAWVVLGSESLVWGAALVRLRLARDRALDEPDEIPERLDAPRPVPAR